MKTAIELIAAERQRQQSALGWTREHDDQHTNHEIAINAAACLLSGTDCALDDWRPDGRPDWGLDEKHKADRARLTPQQLEHYGRLFEAAPELLRLPKSSNSSAHP